MNIAKEKLIVSIVVPVYSGQDYLYNLYDEVRELKRELETSETPFEVRELIFVDDCAIDGSPAIIDAIAADAEWVTALHLSTNFGQHPATIAGILHTSGDWVVTLDEDLQHPPSRIPEMFEKVAETGSDIVYARPVSGVHKAKYRDFNSRLFKKIMVALTGNKNVAKVNSFRVLRGTIARSASAICSHDIFFDVALFWYSDRVATVEFSMADLRYQETGESGYSLRRLLSHARRMIMSSQIKLLRIGGVVGLGVVALSLLFGLFLALRKIIYPASVEIQGWTSIMLVQIFFGGLIVFLTSVTMEFVSLLVQKEHGKPLFYAVDRKSDSVLKAWLARAQS